jgi:hypothetical protein
MRPNAIALTLWQHNIFSVAPIPIYDVEPTFGPQKLFLNEYTTYKQSNVVSDR